MMYCIVFAINYEDLCNYTDYHINTHLRPHNFDPEVYFELYPDLQRAAPKKKPDTKGTMGHNQRTRDVWAITHYLRYGKQEGRNYLPVVPQDFDAEVYLARYLDLQEAVTGDRSFWAQKHYFMHGKQEGRDYLPVVPQYFNPEVYLLLYPDVQAAVTGDRSLWAKKHYFLYGRHEGRAIS